MFFFGFLGHFSYLGQSEEKYYPHMLFISSGSKMILLLGTLSKSQRYKLREN